VTSADGEEIQVVTVTLFVLLNDDTSLSTFTVNGSDVEDGSDVSLPPYTDAVEVVATATDPDAQVEIVGADSLNVGDNLLEVTVTAQDGTVEVYRVNLFVATSSETGVSEILVDGRVAVDKDIILGTDLEMTEVEVEVTTIDENAIVEISGNTDLVLGDNLITIVVTAPSGDTRDYVVTFRLGGLEGNAKLANLQIGNKAISLTDENLNVNLPAGTRFVSVLATPQDSAASVKVTGNKNLVVGTNVVTITVKAADGKTTRVYSVNVTVDELSNDTSLSSILVNGQSVEAGATVQLVAGSAYAETLAIPSSQSSSVSYSGFKNLVLGNNVGTITVRAASGQTQDYKINLFVPALSSDTTLKVFTIEGFDVLKKSKLFVSPGTTKLHISAQANSEGSSVTISTVTVTAADGSTASYTVIVKVSA
ncbi:MAG: hypothetical protein EBT86_11525, partial [Actinobacteria bacterium]|nr:hypothetical protein [Actinomycetota bacterium]